jgi:hypothetical protein
LRVVRELVWLVRREPAAERLIGVEPVPVVPEPVIAEADEIAPEALEDNAEDPDDDPVAAFAAPDFTAAWPHTSQ